MVHWSIGVLLTNAYKVYLQVCKEEKVNPQYKQQYKFVKAIAEYWIEPDLIKKEIFQGTMVNRFESPFVQIQILIVSRLAPGIVPLNW